MSLSARRDGDLQIREEKTIFTIPRGEEELRITFTRAATGRGETTWHTIRVWFRGADGAMHPTKAGVTIRAKELGPVTVALLRATAGSIPVALHAQAKAIVAALESRAPDPGPQRRPSPRPAPSRRAPRELRPPPDLAPLPEDPPDLF